MGRRPGKYPQYPTPMMVKNACGNAIWHFCPGKDKFRMIVLCRYMGCVEVNCGGSCTRCEHTLDGVRNAKKLCEQARLEKRCYHPQGCGKE